jgi:putative oxidoreductase
MRATTATLPMPLPRGAKLAAWTAQLIMAGVLAQTLYFKFTYAPETRYIFARLGGRPAATATACLELICVVLLLTPRMGAWGSLVALGTMGGALATHLLVVGIVIPDPQTGHGDGGMLFGMALTVAVLAGTVLVLRRAEWLPRILRLAGRA